jgi:hypothetical protein
MSLKKRGQSHDVLWWVLNLFFLAIILLTLLYIINSILNNNMFERKYLAKDVALVMNNMYASPNTVLFVYTENQFDFDVRFQKNKVMAMKPKEGEVTGITYPFIEEDAMAVNYKKIKSSVVQIGDEKQNFLLALGFKKTPSRINPMAIINTEEVLK